MSGINVTEIRRSRRNFAGECMDWTQRRGHLNGALAAAITTRLFELGWPADVLEAWAQFHHWQGPGSGDDGDSLFQGEGP